MKAANAFINYFLKAQLLPVGWTDRRTVLYRWVNPFNLKKNSKLKRNVGKRDKKIKRKTTTN